MYDPLLHMPYEKQQQHSHYTKMEKKSQYFAKPNILMEIISFLSSHKNILVKRRQGCFKKCAHFPQCNHSENFGHSDTEVIFWNKVSVCFSGVVLDNATDKSSVVILNCVKLFQNEILLICDWNKLIRSQSSFQNLRPQSYMYCCSPDKND